MPTAVLGAPSRQRLRLTVRCGCAHKARHACSLHSATLSQSLSLCHVHHSARSKTSAARRDATRHTTCFAEPRPLQPQHHPMLAGSAMQAVAAVRLVQLLLTPCHSPPDPPTAHRSPALITRVLSIFSLVPPLVSARLLCALCGSSAGSRRSRRPLRAFVPFVRSSDRSIPCSALFQLSSALP